MARVQDWSDPGKAVMTDITGGVPSGDITVTGNLTVTGTSTLQGAATAPSLTTTGAIQGATVRATGNLRGGSLTVDGSATFNNDIGVVNGAVIQNGLTVQSGTFTANGNCNLGNDPADLVAIPGSCEVNNNLTVDGDASITGELTGTQAVIGAVVATTFAVGAATPQGTAAAIPDATGPGDVVATLNAWLAVARLNGQIAP